MKTNEVSKGNGSDQVKVNGFTLHTLKRYSKAFKKCKRVGRGYGSGKGRTAGKGNNGDKARSGFKYKFAFEGGQTGLLKKLPRRGFKSHKIKPTVITIQQILNILNKKKIKEFTPEVFVSLGFISDINSFYKVIGYEKISDAITVHAGCFSKKAKEAIENSGGKVIFTKKTVE